jgi:hypothetical protein
MNHLTDRIFESKVTNFEELCLELFRFQYQNNLVYKQFAQLLGINDESKVSSIAQIPFLPVDFFKSHAVQSFEGDPEKYFFSSATGGNGQSKHPVKDLGIYRKSFTKAFLNQFGSIENTCILGLLPSYLEREGSSLIYMVQHLMELSGNAGNGFFLYEHEVLAQRIEKLEAKKQPYFLFGVSFALLDFAANFKGIMTYGKIIETGGMKGRKKELTRGELINELQAAFGTQSIYSEYGMTELMSQAYANENGFYTCPPWMMARVVDLNDPMSEVAVGKSGLIQVIDMANIFSCAFIQTSDLGRKNVDGSFQVLGRADNSEMRGCSLMVAL